MKNNKFFFSHDASEGKWNVSGFLLLMFGIWLVVLLFGPSSAYTQFFSYNIIFFWLLSVHKYISVDVKKNQYHRCQHKILGIAKEVFVKPNFYFIFFFTFQYFS